MPIKKRIKTKDRLFGFTMVEMLVVLAIFSSIIAIGSTKLIIMYVSGRTNSSEKSKVNNEMIYVSQMMRQFMATADSQAKIGGTTIEGFSLLNDNLVVFASGTSDDKQCNFLGFDQNTYAVYALQQNCADSSKTMDLTKFQRLTSTDLKVNNFKVNYIDPANQWEGFTWEMRATNSTDATNSNQMTINNTYTLGYEKYQNILSQPK